jgi:nitroreductase
MSAYQEENAILDEMILKRRTIRSFKSDDVSKEMIEQIIKAGFAAPYGAATGLPLIETRKFVVLKRDSAVHTKAKNIIYASVKKNVKIIQFVAMFNRNLREKGRSFIDRLKMIVEKGIPSADKAPYYIIIAERIGIPPVAKQSMAYAMENMWLKATALGLGFQLISGTGMMSKNRAFMDLLGLKVGDYELDGCCIGYPEQAPQKRAEADPKKYIKWLE